MKKRRIYQTKALAISGYLAVALGTTMFACGNSSEGNTQETVTAKSKSSTKETDEVKKATVAFKKDKVYEIVYFTVAPEKQKQVFEEYMPKAKPYFEKYGVQPVGMFRVIESRSDSLKSEMVGIFEWPNYQAKVDLESDRKFKKVAKLRDGGFSFFRGGWFEVKEDKAVTFRSDKVYEMTGASVHKTDEAQQALSKYFEVSEPIKRSYGGAYPEFLVQFAPSDSRGTATYNHDMHIIVEWDKLEDNAKLFDNEKFKNDAVPLLKKALSGSDFVFTKFNFPEQ